MFLIGDYVVFVVVVVVVIDVAAAEFDVLISVDVVASDFEIDDGDSAAAWYFLEIFADYFGELDHVVESAVCRLHLRVPVDLAVFL